MFQHEYEVHSGKHTHNSHLGRKIRKLLSLGLRPAYVKVFESEDEGACYQREVSVIRELGRATLCNLTDGGFVGSGMLGKKHSPETIAKLVAIHKGKRLTAEHKLKISAGGKGRSKSEAAKARMRLSAQNRLPASRELIELRQRHSTASRKASGKPWHSESAKLKISKSNTGFKQSKERVEESRQRMLHEAMRNKSRWIKGLATKRKTNNFGWTESRKRLMSAKMKEVRRLVKWR